MEVLAEYRQREMGSLLIKTILAELPGVYMVDLCCDQKMQTFYETLGMPKSYGMITLNRNCLYWKEAGPNNVRWDNRICMDIPDFCGKQASLIPGP